MLFLVRHGRTAANATGRLQGRLDLPLDDLGFQQAAAAALRVGRPDRLISSPLLRARQTADAFGAPYELDERWEELNYGELEGKPMADVSDSTWAHWRTDNDYALPGGESLAQLAKRVEASCEELIDEARHRTVVVITHVSPIKAALAWSLGVGIAISWRCHVNQASVSRIKWSPNGPVLLGFNDT